METTHNIAKLAKLSAVQLRRYMRESADIRESRIGSARKEEMLHRLEHGEWPTSSDPDPAPAGAGGDDLALAIARAIAGHVPAAAVDLAEVEQVARDVMQAEAAELRAAARSDAEAALMALWGELARPVPITVQVQDGDAEPKDCGIQHKTFPELLMFAASRVHVNLVGPAGSGKTRGASEVAKALGLSFDYMAVGPMSSKADILGYMDAGGTYHASAFRRQYECGGVFLFDEIDAGNPGVMTTINGAIAGDRASFPDRLVERHADFVCIAAANTFGRGANRQYCGRQQLDAATLDRFAVVEWLYDNALEIAIAGDTEWTRHCQSVRDAIERSGVRHVVSPRASIAGNKLLTAGMPRDKVESALIWKGLDPDTCATIQKAMDDQSFELELGQ